MVHQILFAAPVKCMIFDLDVPKTDGDYEAEMLNSTILPSLVNKAFAFPDEVLSLLSEEWRNDRL